MLRKILSLLMLTIILSSIGCGMGQKQVEHKPPEPEKKGLQQLVGDLSSDKSDVREAAFKGVHKLGKDAVPALIRMLDDPNPETRRNAALALGEIGPPNADAAMDKLRAMSRNDPDEVVRKAAADAIKKIETRF